MPTYQQPRFAFVNLPPELEDELYQHFGEQCHNPEMDCPDILVNQIPDLLDWLHCLHPGSNFEVTLQIRGPRHLYKRPSDYDNLPPTSPYSEAPGI